MKQKLTPIVVAMCLLGLNSVSVFVASSQTLEQQVAELKREVAALKAYTQRPVQTHRTIVHHQTVSSHHDTATSEALKNTSPQVEPSAGEIKVTNQLAGQPNAEAISGPQYLPQSGLQYLPIDLDVPGQSFVSTGPYIGVPLQFNGSDLIVNSPSVNEDVSLLNLRKNITQRLHAIGLKDSDQHSHLLLSGVVEGEVGYRNLGGGPNTSNIDLTNVGIDAYILGPSTWTTGLISLRYDNSVGANQGSLSMNGRTQNSRVFVDKAFVILGDFSKSPFYGTIGQMYVPFGQYSSTMISSPLTKLIFRTQARTALIGFQQQNPNSVYGSAFAFRGDTHVGAASRINNGGFNLGYRFNEGKFSGNIGGGYLANIADSQGMQNNGLGAVYVPPLNPIFGGFGGVAGTGNEKIVHRVAAWNARALLSFGHTFDLITEYITAASGFSRADLMMDTRGAKPSALNTELAYTFQCFPKPTSISIGYGMSKNALALGMPAQRWSTALNTSLWRNTLQSIEFRRDLNYPKSATSSGSGLVGPTASGQSDTVVTAHFDIYF